MDETAFWEIIERARREAGDECATMADLVVEHLVTLPPAEIHDFARVMDQLLDRAYSWELWGAAYVINGGCSDDGFEYFRCWLISKGRNTFEAAIRDPESLAKVAEADSECEDLLYAPVRAVERVTGSDELPERYAPFPEDPTGQPWNEDDLSARFPKLTAVFG